MPEFNRNHIVVRDNDSLSSQATERHYSVSEIAKIWNLSEKSVRRIFDKEPGVLRWGSKEKLHKRGYTTLRIPETVVARVHRRLQHRSIRDAA